MAAEELNQNQNGQENGMENATALSLLVVIGEPFYEEQRELVLDRVKKSLKTVTVEGLDVNAELQNVADAAPQGEEGPGGERVAESSSASLRAVVLTNPQCQTLFTQLRTFLTMAAQNRVIVYSGPVMGGTGAWILQDNIVTLGNVAAVFKDPNVQNALKQQEGGKLDWHIMEEGDWGVAQVTKHLSGSLTVNVNPNDEATPDNGGISGFTDYVGSILRIRTSKDLLQSSDVVGNIRFTRPTLYVFPGAQGDSALFGISGFNLLINAGYSKKACFWGFTRHLDRIDAMLLTHLGPDNLFGASSVFERKAFENVHPEIGYVYFNAAESKKNSPNGDINPENGGAHKPPSLVVSLVEQGNRLVENIKMTGQSPQPCIGQIQSSVLQPLNLYHKVGHGTLDMYILNPTQDSKELKDFLSQWSKNVGNFSTKNGIPLPSQTSISALLVWKPTSPNERITRILFPGNTPQQKVFEGLEKLKTLDIFKHPSCSENSLHAPKSQKKAAPAGAKSAKGPSNPRSSPISRASPVPAVKEARKPAERKPPPSREAATKPLKDAKNKKTTAEKTKTPPSSSSASKGPSPATTPASTATPSNTPIESTMEEVKQANVAAEVAASLESEITAVPPSPEAEVKKEEAPEVKQESPVISPEDVSPVIESTPEATPPAPSEPNTADLLGDLSNPPAPIPDLLAPEAVQQEQSLISPEASPVEKTPVESDVSPSVESVSEPSVSEEPQSAPEPVVVPEPMPVPEPVAEPEPIVEPESAPQEFAKPQEEALVPEVEKEQAVEPEKDEDTAELEDSPQPSPSVPEADLLGTFESEATQPNGPQEPVDELMDSPKALPEPVDQNSFDAVAMHASFSEDRGENVFASAQPQREVEELPESEQQQSEDETAKMEKAFDDVLKEDVPKEENLPKEEDIPKEEKAADDAASTQVAEEETPVIEPEEKDTFQEKNVFDDNQFAAEAEQAPAFVPEPEVENEGERKSSLADFGVAEDDATLEESLTQADPETLKELGIYEEPEADQPPAAEPVQEDIPSVLEDDQVAPQVAASEPLVDFGIPDVSTRAPEGDVDVDSLADTAGPDPVAADSLECLTSEATKEVVQEEPTPTEEAPAPEHSFEIVDAPKEIESDPFTNPFVGVDLNASSQPNPFNIPDSASADQAAGPVPCDLTPPEETQPVLMPPQQGDERDSLERDEFNPVQDWGQPMGLPAPDDPPGARKAPTKKAPTTGRTATAKSSATTTRKPADAKKPSAADAKKTPADRAASPRKPATATSRTAKKPGDDAPKKPSAREEAAKKAAEKKTSATAAKKPAPSRSATKPDTKSTPTKASAGTKRPATGSASKPPAPVKLAPVTPFYVELSYVPGHGDSHNVDMEYFRKVRARHYVVSSLEPSAALFDALLEAKQTWEDPTLEVTVIPTYDTDTLRHWMALHRDELSENKIDFAPSASRCTIQLQDHEASCAAYRLEF